MRDVTIDSSRTTTVPVLLDPTPETRAAFVSKATAQRTWGWVAAGRALPLRGGGTVLLVADASSRSSANDALSNIAYRSEKANRDCDPASGRELNCLAEQAAAVKKLNDANARDKIGYVAVGVGGAAVLVGGYA